MTFPIISAAALVSLVSMICGVSRLTSCLDRYVMNSRLSNMLEFERSTARETTFSILAYSVRQVALMMVEKLLIDGLAPAKSFLHTVPKLDGRLAEPPAQIHFLAVEQRRKID